MPAETYIGDELELFENALKWKSYYGAKLKPYLKGDVLEVGAGIGGTTKWLCDGTQKSWLCLEPDKKLANQIQNLLFYKELPDCCSLKVGTLTDVEPSELFDCILYIDVIEHIEDDKKEILSATKHLKKSGVIVILVPAHQWLYSPFDKAIGHFRRYSKKTLAATANDDNEIIVLKYLDFVGLLASSANKLLLKQKYPTLEQIKFWDGYMVPASKIIDPLIMHQFGKSLLMILQKV